MFTIQQINEAHSKVKSGADFPNYIQDLAVLGVTSYTTYVSDGHTFFSGKDNFRIQSAAKYAVIEIADDSDKERFQHELKAHQQGQTGYLTFCRQCGETGVDKWVVDIAGMTCTYFDKEGNQMLVEKIPG